MPSKLIHSITLDIEVSNSVRSFTSPPPTKKQKMSLSQTYFIASSARAKLGKEAMRPDHNLRLLVGHANLLDSLMVELKDAEREQDAWFNASVRKASREEEPKHIRWADTVVEEDDSESDSDSDSDYDESDFQVAIPARLISSPVTIESQLEDEEEMGYADFDFSSSDLALVRTSSHPPDLVDDSDSEDELSPPTTPPSATLEFSEKDVQSATLLGKSQTPFTHLIPESQAPLIESY